MQTALCSAWTRAGRVENMTHPSSRWPLLVRWDVWARPSACLCLSPTCSSEWGCQTARFDAQFRSSCLFTFFFLLLWLHAYIYAESEAYQIPVFGRFSNLLNKWDKPHAPCVQDGLFSRMKSSIFAALQMRQNSDTRLYYFNGCFNCLFSWNRVCVAASIWTFILFSPFYIALQMWKQHCLSCKFEKL